ncbi:hypothetical protein JD82_00375 [Prauserella rugosa]|uniref:Uncharacterized protein n=1 Tax=Prauserella rugosa TaxID=43354 RepID=A0A660C5D0_9PSEU|nr:hypothetical protein JD82_00375 [Prauserella rugosa]
MTGFYYPGFSFLATCPRCAAPGPHHSGYLEAQPPTVREVETSPGEYELVRRWGAIPAGVKRTCTACGNGWQERLDR